MPTQHYERGPYKAVIIDQRFGTTPTGTPYLAIEFNPTQSTGANSLPETVYSRELTLYFSEKAAPYSIKNLRRIGWEGDSLEGLNPSAGEYESLADIEIDVVCSYNDKGYEQWDLPAPGGVAKESDASVPAKLDKLFGKVIKASVPKGAAQKKRTVPDDDDIPF